MDKEYKAVFDTKREIAIKLQSSEGPKALTVRFPTDDEWIDRQRKRKIIIKQLGRGMSETIVPESTETDLDLLNQLRTGEAPEIDGYEATRILEELSQADVDDVIQDGAVFRVTLRVPGGITVHRLKMPSARDVLQYRRAFARVIDLPNSKQQLTVNLAAAGDLYKLLFDGMEGYGSAVPIIHQAVAVKAVIDSLDSGLGVAGSENF